MAQWATFFPFKNKGLDCIPPLTYIKLSTIALVCHPNHTTTRLETETGVILGCTVVNSKELCLKLGAGEAKDIT